jgi:hypothetical protein
MDEGSAFLAKRYLVSLNFKYDKKYEAQNMVTCQVGVGTYGLESKIIKIKY